MPSRSLPTMQAAIVVGICVAIAVSPLLVSAATFDLTVSGAIDTPTEEVTIEGNQYTVSSVAQIGPGEPLTISVDVPDGQEYLLELYNSEEQIEDFHRETGPATLTFDETDQYGVGSYMAALYVDGVHETIQPVVIAGYDVTTEHPSNISADDESVTVNVTVTETAADGAPENGAEVALWRENQTIRVKATHVTGPTYRAVVDGAQLTAGSYELYAGALGPPAYDGEYEVLGVSSGSVLEVTESEDSTGDDPVPPPPPSADDGGDDTPPPDSDPVENTTNDTVSQPTDPGNETNTTNDTDDTSGDGTTLLPANNTSEPSTEPAPTEGPPVMLIVAGLAVVFLAGGTGLYLRTRE